MQNDTGREYNGWSNYETWNVALWLNSDEGLYHRTKEMIEYFKEKNYQYPLEKYISDELEWMVEGMFTDNGKFEIDEGKAGKFGDLDSIGEMKKVNYEEIALSLIGNEVAQ